MPLCESRITGLRALVDAAETVDTAKTAVSEAAMVAARTDLNGRTGDMGAPVKCGNSQISQKTLYLTAMVAARLVDIRHK